MTASQTKHNADETRLWLAALLISIALNGVILVWVSYRAIIIEISRQISIVVPAEESVITIYPEMLLDEADDQKPNVSEKERAVRTSDDQLSKDAPDNRRYIGERNTLATSDREATSEDHTMPSQLGREPLPEELPETTVSQFQDGRLDVTKQENTPDQRTPSPSELVNPLSPSTAELNGEKQPDPRDADINQTATRETLMDGPNVIPREVPRAEVNENIKPREEKKTRDGDPQGLALEKSENQIKPTSKQTTTAMNDPAFSGNQSKTTIRGNISRTGRSALDVADTPMGRYQAQISRAVELEFQRNCVRRRDFIVPGYITVRFYLDVEGRVSSLNLIGDIEGGEVQKGFTIDSIRNAEIPIMPEEIKKELGDDNLELIYNFYF